jgi:putative transposase
MEYNGVLRWKGKQQRGQVKFKDGKFYLHQPVEINDVVKKPSKIYAGLDLGIKRFLAVRTSNGETMLSGSKRFYSQWMYLTDKISGEQSKLDLQGKRVSKRLLKLYSRRKIYLNNLFNNLTAKLFRFLVRNNVSVLVVGDVKGIREDNDMGKRVNKMMHNYWSFYLQLKKIENKCEEHGIELRLETEEYTSRTCPICGDCSKENVKDRIFICSLCGFIEDRDIIGAGNILSKSMYGSDFKSIHWGEISPLEEAWQ